MPPVESAPWRHALYLGIPVALLANAAVIFAVVESPYGSLGFFDDSPTTSDWLLPLSAGVVLGGLEVLILRARIVLAVAGATMFGGFLSLLFIHPAALLSAGSVIGAGLVAVLGRRIRSRISSVLPASALVVVTVAAVGYGVVERPPEAPPLIEVLTPSDGPMILIDAQERITSTSVTGILADVDGCLGLTDASIGDGTVVVLWRHSTAASSSPYELVIGGERRRLGDRVSVHGAGLVRSDEDPDAFHPDMPSACAGHDLFM